MRLKDAAPVIVSRLPVLLLLAFALALAACGGDPSGQRPAPSGEALQAERVEVEGFGLARAWADERDGGLSLALEFSQPLVATQDFDRLITLDGPAAREGGWSLDEDNRTLRFPNAQANREYAVTISGRLTAADGSELGEDARRSIHTGDLAPLAGFASQGSVLPARGSRGLPVVSLNVPEVDVEFLRVRESELPRFFNQYQRAGRRGSWTWMRTGATARRFRAWPNRCTSTASCSAASATSASSPTCRCRTSPSCSSRACTSR